MLIWTNGQLDFSLIGCYFVGGLFAIGIFMAISITFRLSARAGLNIGIAQTIWGFTPFLSSILDFLIYGTRLQLYHVAGISCMLAAAICISLSNLFKDKCGSCKSFTNLHSCDCVNDYACDLFIFLDVYEVCF